MPIQNLLKASKLVGRLAKIAAFNPRGLRPILGSALAASENHLVSHFDPTRIPSIDLEQLFEEASSGQFKLELHFRPKVGFSISPIEALALGTVVCLSQARLAFEFGTYRGISSTQIALNLLPGGRLFTLDLPPDHPALKFALKEVDEMRIARERTKGDLIPPELLSRVEFLHADSATFDETPYHESMDLVFVDGAHTFEYVQNDSAKGWRMLKPGGWMVWHDCRAQTPDVVRFLIQCPYKSMRIQGTTFAFARKP